MKKTSIIIFIMVNMLAMFSCSDEKKNNSENDEDGMPLSVSIIQLIANPAEYHGKKIRVKGVGNLSFEGTSVYLCIDNWYYLANKNAIWVSIDSEIVDNELWYYINGERISEEEACKKYNGKYVLIEGTFDMYSTGYRGGYSGNIYDVTRYADWSSSNRSLDKDTSIYNEHMADIDAWFEDQK